MTPVIFECSCGFESDSMTAAWQHLMRAPYETFETAPREDWSRRHQMRASVPSSYLGGQRTY